MRRNSHNLLSFRTRVDATDDHTSVGKLFQETQKKISRNFSPAAVSFKKRLKKV
jgi:hypothetical protein